MAAAFSARQREYAPSHLHSELAGICRLAAKEIEAVESFLFQEGHSSLEEVDLQVMATYRAHIRENMDKAKAGHYGSLLETAMLRYLSPYYEELIREVDEAFPLGRAEGNKLKMFLMVAGIKTIRDISYRDRQAFEGYLASGKDKHTRDYTKLLDRLKLTTIRRECEKPFGAKKKLAYANDVIFLGYHPDIQVAMEFYYIRNKEELAFDFSLPAPMKLKKQVFAMLTYSLEREMDHKNRRELYIVPLKKLYLYCAETGIEDIEKMMAEDIEGFYRSMDGKAGTKTKIYMQIIGTTRRFLFLSAERTNWEATVWYMDRFNFKDDRVNPALHIDCFRFCQIKDEDNRACFMEYMKYLIGISGKALTSVQAKYYAVRQLCLYCDGRGLKVKGYAAADMDAYISHLEEKEMEEGTFNRIVESLASFFSYLVSKDQIRTSPICVEYYRKKAAYPHHDRTVDWEVQMDLLRKLKYFPEHLRLMCVTIWATGIRVNEVCTIRGGALSFDGVDAFLTVMQYKMVSEKKIPIPYELYTLLQEYIEKKQIQREEFVFKSKKGRAYDASTFTAQVKRLCWKYEVGGSEYIFRPHDYRHTVATEMFDEGVSLQAIREYHGHRDESMTRQYIDYMPGRVDKANKEYFEAHRVRIREGEKP